MFKKIIGTFLVILGTAFFLDKLIDWQLLPEIEFIRLFVHNFWDLIWPIVLITSGVLLVSDRNKVNPDTSSLPADSSE